MSTKSRYRPVHCLIWNDDKFPFLSMEGKLVFLHLLTTPMSTPFGCYKAGLAALQEESRIDEKGYRKGFAEGLAKGLYEYDERHLVVFLKRFVDYNPPNNPNVLRRWGKVFQELPPSPLKAKCYRSIDAACKGYSKGFAEAFAEAFENPLAKGMANQEQEQEQEQEQDIYTLADPDGPTVDAEKPSATTCPHQKIIELYHQHCPSLPRVREWNTTRKTKLRARYMEKKERRDLDWWAGYFTAVEESDFLTGRKPAHRDSSWQASLDWLVTAGNMIKVIEGNYKNKGGKSNGTGQKTVKGSIAAEMLRRKTARAGDEGSGGRGDHGVGGQVLEGHGGS